MGQQCKRGLAAGNTRRASSTSTSTSGLAIVSSIRHCGTAGISHPTHKCFQHDHCVRHEAESRGNETMVGCCHEIIQKYTYEKFDC